jgi:hypothetical protein
MAKGTRKETTAEIMEWSATWGLPLSREQAEAKADQVTKAMRPHRGSFSSRSSRCFGFALLLQLSPTDWRID